MKKFIKKISVIVLSIITVVCTFCTAAIPAFAASTASVKTGSYYTVSNVGSGKYLNIYGSKNANNTNVTVYQKDGTKGQSFMFTKNGNGYTITPKCSTSRRVNVYGTSAKQNANVCIWNSTGSSTQRWIVKEVSGGYIICCADNANYVLTATGSKNSSNVNLQKYTGSKYQIWKSSAFNTSSSSNTSTAKTLSINWNLIKKTGKQSVSGPCGCYAFAYCRDIIDNSQHYWTQYSEGYLGNKGRYSYSFVASKASYNKKTSSSITTVYNVIYDNINKGKPVVINVKGGRSSGCHYVAVVGYTNVKSTSSLSAYNFLIVDSAGGGYNTENLGSLGYSLRNSNGYTYYVD